jgi:SET domain-containing protein|tara:strand:- start:119 stop:520 length:402 start_codon:yes stop_codon:yes gene_type:complete
MKDKLVIHKGLEVGASVKHGYGVFATEQISSGSIVEECMVCIQTIPLSSGILSNYSFAGPLLKLAHESSGNVKYCVIPTGFAMIYNHDSKEPNLEWEHNVDNRLIVFKAKKDILPGEELTHNYGPSFINHKKL